MVTVAVVVAVFAAGFLEHTTTSVTASNMTNVHGTSIGNRSRVDDRSVALPVLVIDSLCRVVSVRLKLCT